MTALIILDGFGYTNKIIGNAVHAANTKNIDKLWLKYPHTFLNASGLSVGLPEGQMGNSEVGHLNLGAGRIVYQELTRITKSIESGSFFKNPELLRAIENTKKNKSSLHLLGLLSDGGVHSHNTHLYGLLELAKHQDIKKVYIHCFLDGRDTPPKSSVDYLEQLENKIKEIGVGQIASISGRYYSMDRDKRWERTKLAYDALVLGKGEYSKSSKEAIENAYKSTSDEFVLPTIIKKEGETTPVIEDNDSIIFFNFRPDRARQITRAIMDENFNGFVREKRAHPLTFITMTQYDTTIENVYVAYPPETINNTLGEYISNKGLKQLRIAETEKYAHVTYFFNGGIEKKFKGEDRMLIPSPKVATYNLQPEMSAYEVTKKAVEAINSEKYDLMILNYANADMVGHTGDFKAAIKAVETVDGCVNKVIQTILKNKGKAIITADHGNAEQMLDYNTNKPHTAHTSNKVKCIIVGGGELVLKEGKLADIAATLLELMNLEKPKEMTGESIIR
ncbi:MAG TPA: 2,3-bisphosphoglycerate-independent phosphoglycerate mutase [Eubacteriaceae bacterium]|jgi:2,3-bisphosphoglycerate-independent phosphoglycerate mutase|nr:2,3-bisphosphoglycerate-independent phosphoglycerate mutase [Eubacteriaceae bacterium]